MNKKQIRIQQDAIMRKIRKRKMKSNKAKSQIRSFKSSKRKHYKNFKLLEVIAPQIFTLHNLERVIGFVNQTEKECAQFSARSLKVNLDNVKEIDTYAISLLLSMLNRISHKNINYWGTYPKYQAPYNYILESGFLDVMKSNVIRKPNISHRDNQIFMVGKDSVDSHRIGKAVRQSISHILGCESSYPPVYDNMLEICANSVEHANHSTIDKNWLVSISFIDDYVHYILTDTGFGILSTLKKKKIQKIKDIISKDETEVLSDVFHKVYQSITGEINRHKGLPIIWESFAEGFVSNLKVLTNNVFYDFETERSLKLKHGFKGVLYSWTVSRVNYEKWLKSL